MKRVLWICCVFLLILPQESLGQAKLQAMAPEAAAAAAGTWDPSLTGKWTYRSYLNRADVIVWDDPNDQATRNLVAIFGQGSTVNNAAKALSLIFGEAVMTFDPPSGNSVTGNLDMGGGLVLDLKGTVQTTPSGDISVELIGTGRKGTDTETGSMTTRR
jgi:hypothetical protein